MKPSTFTAKILPEQIAKLQADLEEQGFTFTKPVHTVFSAKKKGVVCTLYESGSLVVQGKEMGEFIEFYLEPEVLNEFKFSHPDVDLDLSARIGLDEAGKGDFFGPLCIGGVYADEDGIRKLRELGVRDSKRFSDESILKLARKIRAAFPYTVIRLFPQKYNELYGRFKNLNRLLAWAHASALGDLSQKTGCKKAILDQFADRKVAEQALQQKRIEVELIQRVRGEADPVVAAASILARAGFLEGMETLSQEIGSVLPKGAGKPVLTAGVKLVVKHGPDVLEKVAKTHFKTKGEILARVT